MFSSEWGKRGEYPWFKYHQFRQGFRKRSISFSGCCKVFYMRIKSLLCSINVRIQDGRRLAVASLEQWCQSILLSYSLASRDFCQGFFLSVSTDNTCKRGMRKLFAAMQYKCTVTFFLMDFLSLRHSLVLVNAAGECFAWAEMWKQKMLWTYMRISGGGKWIIELKWNGVGVFNRISQF